MGKKICLALSLVLLFALASGTWAGASAGDPVVPFKGDYITYPVLTIPGYPCWTYSIPAVGEATQLGESTFFSTLIGCVGGGQSGSIDFTAANGDQLFTSFTGQSTRSGDTVSFVGTYTIEGGTGRFAGAEGKGEYRGWSGLNEGDTGGISFNGTLEK